MEIRLLRFLTLLLLMGCIWTAAACCKDQAPANKELSAKERSSTFLSDGLVFLQQKRHALALQCFDKAAKLDPTNKDVKSAVETTRVLMSQPLLESGIISWRKGDLKDAEKNFRAALVMSPPDGYLTPRIRIHLGKLLLQMGREKEALIEFDKADYEWPPPTVPLDGDYPTNGYERDKS